jgi:DNA transposition AAA+ family ATPase
MHAMNLTIREIRLRNLLKLIEKSQLSQTAFACKVETSPAYLSQIISIKTKRNMGDMVARKIELSLKMPKGWMDSLHGDEE